MQSAPRRNQCPFRGLGYLRLFQFYLAFDFSMARFPKAIRRANCRIPSTMPGKPLKPREGQTEEFPLKTWEFSRKAERKWKSLQSFQAKNG
jgi:hypothetical protein